MADNITPVTPAVSAPAPNFKFQDPGKKGKLETFLIPSKTALDRAKYDKVKLADIDDNLRNGYIQSDAENDTDSRYALHTIQGKPAPSSIVPDERYKVDIDTQAMRANISNPESGLSADEQIRLGRALQIFDKMVENNFSVMKGPGDVYWLESNENGKKVYAANGILEVAELVNKYNKAAETKVSDTKVGGGPKTVPGKPAVKKLSDIVAKNPAPKELTKSENWHLRSIGTDAATTAIGLLGKFATAGTGGAGFMAGLAGTAVSVTGGVAATAMSMYGDYLDKDVTNGEMWGNAGTRLALEAVETASIVPASMLGTLSGATKAGKILRKALQFYMASGVVSTAVGTDWIYTMNALANGDGGVDEWRKAATMFQFIAGAAGSAVGRSKTKSSIAENTKTAHEPYKEFSDGKLATKQQIAADPKFNRLNARVNKLKSNTETTALEQAAAAKSLQAKTQRKLEATRAKEINANKTPAPPIVGKNGQTEIDFNAPPRPTTAEIKDRYKPLIKNTQTTRDAELVRIEGAKKERLELLDQRRAAGTNKLREKLEKADNNKVTKLHEESVSTAKSNLDTSIEKSLKENGTTITNRLVAKGEKASGVPEAALKASKPADVAAPTPTAVAKEKIAALEKTKKEIQADIAKGGKKKEVKAHEEKLAAIEKEIAENVKATTGVRGAKNRLVENSKKAGKSTLNKAGSLASKVAAVPNYIASSDGVNSRALTKSFMASDIMDNNTGNRFYEYTEAEAKSELAKRGYSESEINRFSLKQLRAALRAIEQEELNDKSNVIINTTPSKRPKLIAHRVGGKIQKFQYGAFMPPVGSASVIQNMVLTPVGKDSKSFHNYIKTGKVLPEQPFDKYKVTKLKSKDSKVKNSKVKDSKDVVGELTNVVNTIINSSGTVRNAAIDDAKAKRDQAVAEAKESEKQAVKDKYDAIIASAKTAKPGKFSMDYSQIANLLGDLKPADLFSKNKIFIERPIQEDVRPVVLHSRGVRNMPGYEDAIARSMLMPRVDTADSWAANSMKLAMNNEGEKRRSELVARNASFVENSRAEDIAVRNNNLVSANEADNANIQRRNQAEAMYSNQLAQGKAQKHMLDQQQRGRVTNAFSSGITKVFKNNTAAKLTKAHNDLASIKSIWNNEVKPSFDIAAAAGKTDKLRQLKAEFIQQYKYDPDELDRQMMDIKAQYKTLGV